MIDIAGAAGIPATKLFGRSPEGMNATGESDLTNYYDMIAQEQESKLRPILNKLLPVMCMSTFGAVPDDLDFEFDPVSEPSDKDRSDLAKSQTENVVTVFNAGLISARTALKELKQQGESIGAWSNISDEDIQKASDEVEPAGEMGGLGGMGAEEYGEESPNSSLRGRGEYPDDKPPQAPGKPPQMPKSAKDSDWKEDEHPRDEGGRFTSGGGTSGASSGGSGGGYNSVSVRELPMKNGCRRFDVDGKTYSQVRLPSKEHGMVMHAVDTYITPDKIDERLFLQPIDNYLYGILIVDEDVKDYVVTMKKPI